MSENKVDNKVDNKVEPVLFICLACARERGYKAPMAGNTFIFRKLGRCDYCGATAMVYDKDSLTPAWENP